MRAPIATIRFSWRSIERDGATWIHRDDVLKLLLDAACETEGLAVAASSALRDLANGLISPIPAEAVSAPVVRA